MKMDLKANEVVLKATDSKYLYDSTSVQGKLVLTNQRLYFVSGNGHPGSMVMEFLPAQIHEVIPFSTALFAPRGLNLVTKEGKEYRFTMKKRDEWGTVINRIY